MGSPRRQAEWVSNILKDLLSIETVIPPGRDYKIFADYSSRVLKSLGTSVSVVKVPKSAVSKYNPEYASHARYIVLARLGSGHPILHFNGHYDVVPEGHGWKKSPFSPTVSGGRIYGRGASDMKSGIASIMMALKSVVESGKSLGGTLEVSLTPDEEIGGHAGVEYMLASGLSRPDFALIAEPTGLDKVLIGHKGSLQILIEVHGANAHGSMPWRGLNAFEGVVGLASAVQKRYDALVRGRKSKLHYSDSRAARPTAMYGGIVRGGEQQNLVPAYCAFSIDRRVIPEEDPRTVEVELLGCVKEASKARRFSKYRVSTRILNRVKPAATRTDSAFLHKVRRAVKSVVGVPPQLEMAVGAMDAGYYIRRGIDTVAYGPGELSQAHSANESVAISDLVSAAKVYEKLTEELF